VFTPSNKKFTTADLCAYCAIEPSKPGVGDHVIPRCIFEFESHSAIRQGVAQYSPTGHVERDGHACHPVLHVPVDREARDPVRVPACERCNGQKSKDEGFVRDWLCSHADVDLSAVPQTVYDAFIRSANEHNNSAIANAARKHGRYEPRFTESGLYADKGFSYPLDYKRIIRMFERVAQGLYYAAGAEGLRDNAQHPRLPRESQFEVWYVHHARIEDQATFLSNRGAGGPISLGGGACDILFGAKQTDKYIVTRSMVMFYNRSVAVDIQTDIIFDDHDLSRK